MSRTTLVVEYQHFGSKYTTEFSQKNLHSIGVHGLAGVELEVLEIGKEGVLDELLGASLERLDLILGLASILETLLDSLHVACSLISAGRSSAVHLARPAGAGEGARVGALTLEISKVGLLVEAGALETERMDDVVDLDDLILEGLLSLLSGSVGANV